MEDNKILQAILEKLNEMSGDIADLKEGQKSLEKRQTALEEGQKSLEEGLKILEEGQKILEEGQNALRRDIARVERKIDKQGNDIADTLYYLTQGVDSELSKLKAAK